MDVVFLRSFEKDLAKISDRTVRRRMLALFEEMKGIALLRELRDVKKLAGHREAYRLRISNYRLGFFCDGKTIELARLLHRSEIYKQWP